MLLTFVLSPRTEAPLGLVLSSVCLWSAHSWVRQTGTGLGHLCLYSSVHSSQVCAQDAEMLSKHRRSPEPQPSPLRWGHAPNLLEGGPANS